MKRLLLTLLLCAACSEAAPTTSNLLSRRVHFEREVSAPPGWTIEQHDQAGERTIHQAIAPEAIHLVLAPDLFEVTVDFIGFEPFPDPEACPYRFSDSNGSYKFVALAAELFKPAYLSSPDGLPPGSFTLYGGKLYCKAFEAAKPLQARYSARIDPKHDPQGDPHLTLTNSSFEGFAVLPGETANFGSLEWEPGAELLLDLAAFGRQQGTSGQLSLSLDGELLTSLPLQPQPIPERRPHRIKLPDDKSGAELKLTCSGDSTAALVLSPTLTRPDSERPDFTIFLADTFRADNLSTYGGDPLVTPEMDAFAAESVRFQAAWSSASWTLPSHASLFTSLQPPRHGATFMTARLDGQYQTLAEILHEAGWRTVAITEGGFLHPSFGLGQGFERFIVEDPLDIATTLKNIRAELERDDGRPLFLFIQSFRAHSPYTATSAAMAQLPHIFGPNPAPENWVFKDFVQAIEDEAPGSLSLIDKNGLLAPEALAAPDLERFTKLYRGGAADTSRGFGQFLGMLDEFGLGDAHVVLTSDHGEAFGEHGITGHANSSYEQCIHIPLLIRTPERTSARVTAPASLIDLAPTFLELADLAMPAVWQGTSLVPALNGQATPHPTFSFETPNDPERLPAEVALRRGDHKVLASFNPNTGEIFGPIQGFDLAVDPGELNPLAGAKWTEELAAELRAAIEEQPAPLFAPSTGYRSPSELARLAALGYLSGEPDPVDHE